MGITLIASVTAGGFIGADGDLAWRNSEDLKHFKTTTVGHTLVMGRRTYESIGRALPGRRTIVVTRDRQWSATGVETAGSVAQALDLAGDGRIFVAGGGQLYAQTMDLAEELDITHVEADPPGDTKFPLIDPTVWQVIDRQQRDGFAFVRYHRRKTSPAGI